MSAFTPSACDAIFQWVIQISYFTTDKRTIFVPEEFGICHDLTPVELLSVLYKKWVSAFGKDSIPDDLSHGQKYHEHIKTLIASHSEKKPYMTVDRESFRFFLSKIEREFNTDEKDYEIEFSYTTGQLKISVKSTVVFVPSLYCKNITSEKISLQGHNFFKSIPRRFRGNTVGLAMKKNGLLIGSRLIEARWDGDDLWKHDEYDDFLKNRLIQKSLMFV